MIARIRERERETERVDRGANYPRTVSRVIDIRTPLSKKEIQM